MKNDLTSKSSDPPHLTTSINQKRQEAKDYLLRLAAASNPLIDHSIMNSKIGQKTLNSLTHRNMANKHY